MRIAIIGFDGQLGMDCQKILATEHELLTPSLEELDLCNVEMTSNYLLAHKPEVVINCAAYTAVDKCEEEQQLCNQINNEGPGILARSCKEMGSRLIHISTDYVFDGNKSVPQAYTEQDPVNPLSQYGRTKLEGERKVEKYCDDYIILRTAWLYSANGPNFLKTMLRITLADPQAERKVVDDQYGSLTWSLTLARQIGLLLGPEVQGIAHATSLGYSTWYEAACYFLEKLDIPHKLTPCSTAEYPTPTHRPANSILANTVLEEKNLSVFTDWKTDLDTFIQNHGNDWLLELGEQS